MTAGGGGNLDVKTTFFDIDTHNGDIGGSICTPCKFNGKELDDETGYYYYGARYYDPGTALWFGIDPLAHINPQVSPYVYCKSNPVCRIDPDGRADWKAIAQGTLSIYSGSKAIQGGGGLSATPTGVGQATGAILISTGVATIGLGVTKIIAGVSDNRMASSIPSGVGENIGQAIDVMSGNALPIAQTIGSCLDATVGFAGNIIEGSPLTLENVVSNMGSALVDVAESVVYCVKTSLENIPLCTYQPENNINERDVCPKDKLKVDRNNNMK